MLGNIRRTEHLEEAEKAPPTANTAGTDVCHYKCVFVCVCVCVCVCEMSPHRQTELLLPAAGQRSAGGSERRPGRELTTGST